MQWFVSMIFSNEMHRPSSAKLWQMPMPPTVLPTPQASPLFFRLERTVPLDEHETSYFADSVNILSFSNVCSVMVKKKCFILRKSKDKAFFDNWGRFKEVYYFIRKLFCYHPVAHVRYSLGRIVVPFFNDGDLQYISLSSRTDG